MGIETRAYANVADVILVWDSDRIDGCLGFAVQRKDQSGAAPSWIPTYMPFAPAPAAPSPAGGAGAPAPAQPHSQPSDVWPIQRYIWTDYPDGRSGLQYQVVPVLGTPGNTQPDLASASPWTDPVTCATGSTPGFEMWFTRGIVASPSVQRAIQAIIDRDTAAGKPAQNPAEVLRQEISDPASQLRQDLAGPVLPALRSLLASAQAQGLSVNAALYELNDPELIGLLAGLGQSFHLVLGNGSYSPAQPDENAAVATGLQGKVDLSRRILKGGPFAHNKFLVLGPDGAPQSVWTGSTNWTMTGLCTQSNNALHIHDPAVAASFLGYWQRLRQHGNDPGRTFAADNLKGAFDGAAPGVIPGPPPAGVRAWHAALPTATGKPASTCTSVDDLVDLGEAARLIRAAQHGVLFLMFEPGPAATSLIKPIEDLAAAGKFVHGVINQAPTGDTTGATLTLFNRGARTDDQLSVILPEILSQPLAGEDKETRLDNVMIHSKLIVVDPFGGSPVVMTGSHNMGKKASTENDDNLVIITGTAGLAREYAVYIQGVFDAYKWRYELSKNAKAGAASSWSGLARDGSWQDGSPGQPSYLDVARPQIQFWLGDGG